MSFREAVADGIRFERDGHSGNKVYFPPCDVCGTPVRSQSYRHGVKYACQSCREIRRRAQSMRERRLSEAVQRYTKTTGIAPGEKAVARVQSYLDDETEASSVAEIMIMLELCRRGILFLRRFHALGYTADFVLVDMMVFLQIGHEDSKAEREHRRGLARTVSREFCNRWEVVYVRENMVLTNIRKLLPAIRGEVKRRRKKSA